jgi:hypothetical protein
MTASLELGFINTLYTWFQKTAYPDRDPQPMTAAGLVSLIAAFPITIAYKLIMGADNPPFPGGTLRPKPGLSALAEGRLGDTNSTMWMIASGVTAFFYTAADIANDMLNMTAAWGRAIAIAGAILGWALLLTGLPAFGVDAAGNMTVSVGTDPVTVWSWADWVLGVVVTLADTFLAFSYSMLLRNNGGVFGAMLVSLLGLLQFSASVAVSIKSTGVSVLWRVGNAIQPLSPLLQCLRTSYIAGARDPYSTAAYYGKGIVVNGVADALGGLLCILGTAGVA